MGVRLVEWLNGLPEVKQILETDFENREITEQNLSEWKSHGYLQWQKQQESLARADELKTNAAELVGSAGDLSDSLARLVTARFADLLYDWNGEMTDEFRGQLRGLRALSREVVRLRRSDQFLERMKIQREWLALGSEASALNQRRYEDAKREQEERALALCLQDAREAPEIWKLFEQAFEALEKARAAK